MNARLFVFQFEYIQLFQKIKRANERTNEQEMVRERERSLSKIVSLFNGRPSDSSVKSQSMHNVIINVLQICATVWHAPLPNNQKLKP